MFPPGLSLTGVRRSILECQLREQRRCVLCSRLYPQHRDQGWTPGGCSVSILERIPGFCFREGWARQESEGSEKDKRGQGGAVGELFSQQPPLSAPLICWLGSAAGCVGGPPWPCSPVVPAGIFSFSQYLTAASCGTPSRNVLVKLCLNS